jgi:hypothetical protein
MLPPISSGFIKECLPLTTGYVVDTPTGLNFYRQKQIVFNQFFWLPPFVCFFSMKEKSHPDNSISSAQETVR